MNNKRKSKPEEEGIYRKDGKPALWLRYSYEGQQVRVALHTRDWAEAIALAKDIRGRPPAKATAGDPEFSWSRALDRYFKEKAKPERPSSFTGKNWRTFRPGTANKVRSCLTKFSLWSKTKSPQEVTKKRLEEYRDLYAKNSNASARTTLAQILAFLEHVNVPVGQIQMPEKRKLERRELVLSIGVGNAMIDGCKNANVKFALYCGFHAGLRRGEITHAKVGWFHFDLGMLKVPRVDESGPTVFEVKDSESRSIPLTNEFTMFLKGFLSGKKRDDYCMSNPTTRRSKTGTYDFIAPFRAYSKECEQSALYPHAMRHSWISELCNSGNHSIQEVAAWSGDTIETIEKNYWHKKTTRGALDLTMRGVRQGDEERKAREDISELLKLFKQGKVTAKEAENTLEEFLNRSRIGQGEGKTFAERAEEYARGKREH